MVKNGISRPVARLNRITSTRALFWLTLCVITILLLAPFKGQPSWSPTNSDKLVHMGVFALLAVLMAAGYPKLHKAFIALTLTSYGSIIELIEKPLPYRSFEVADIIADTSGVAIGLVGITLFYRFFRRQSTPPSAI